MVKCGTVMRAFLEKQNINEIKPHRGHVFVPLYRVDEKPEGVMTLGGTWGGLVRGKRAGTKSETGP